MKFTRVFMICLLLMSWGASAQDKPDTKSKMKDHKQAESKTAAPSMPDMMPKPAPEMEKVSKMLVGTWNSKGTFEKSDMIPNGGSDTGVETVKRGPGGLSIISDYNAHGTMGKFQGHGLMSWDPKAQAYKATWCDSMSPDGCEDGGVGKWEGDNLIFTGTGQMGDQKYSFKQTYTDIKPDSFTFVMESGAPDGSNMKKIMTIKYVRAVGKVASAEKKPETKNQ